VHAFDVLGDPVRRRIIELLAGRELPAGEIAEKIRREFGISQPAVSAHLRVLRDSGFASARPDGARRLYSVEGEPLAEVEEWASRMRGFWNGRMRALDTELARGRRARRERRGERRE